MADVSRDRGQLILVAALAIAVTFVSLALVLNTAIYTENMATRSSDIAGGSAALQFERVTRNVVAELLVHANEKHNETHETLAGNLTEGIDHWANATGRQYALSGAITEIRNVDTINGSKLVQNVSQDFTSADGAATWTLADDVNDVRRFQINVSRSSLVDSSKTLIQTGVDTVFNVHFQDGDGEKWHVYIYKNTTGSTSVNVTVEKPGGSFTTPCSAVDSHVVVNFTAGTLDASQCSALALFDDVDDPFTVSYNDTTIAVVGDTGTGTYRIVLDDPAPARNPSPEFNDGPSGNSPWAAPLLYAVELDAVYESPSLRYNTSIRITPGDADG